MENSSKNNEVQIFEFNNSDIQIVLIENEPWFVAKDICDVLGLTNPSESLKALDYDEKLTSEILRAGQNRNVNLINESGLYSLVFRSNKEEAKTFRKWVTSEVLPSLRKTGKYEINDTEPKEEPLMINIIADKDHGFLIIGRDVALGYGVSHNTVRCHKFHNKDKELFEGLDYFNNLDVSDFYPDSTEVKSTVYTKSGAVKMGKHVRGNRSKAFMDYLKNLFPKASHGETVSVPVPKKEKHDRLTKDRKLDIMQEIMQIKDDDLRIRLAQKLLEG